MPNTISEAHELASPAAAPQTQRRLASQHVREARDRLTSTSGTRPVFDYELLRQFAQNRISASPVILLLVVTIGLLSGLWTGALTSGVWTGGALLIHLVIIRKCKLFLDETPGTANLRSWRMRFILLDLFGGNRDALLGQEDAYTARVRGASAVIEFHRRFPLYPVEAAILSRPDRRR